MSKPKIKIIDLVYGNYIKEIPRKRVSMIELMARKRIKLVCDNPGCEGVIRTNIVAYHTKYNEFYHPEECFREAVAYRTTKTGRYRDESKEIYLISRDQALRLKLMLEESH